jgi:hypothetical protein
MVMSIPESQLDTWSKLGSVTQSRDTYATIKRALEAGDAPYAAKSYDTFLQGSYGNDTNIYADSDVDVVMRLDSVYYTDLSRLSDAEKVAYQSASSDASYTFGDFQRQVITHLTNKFGTAVRPGKKAIFINGSGSRRDADVLVCAAFRRYYKFSGWSNQDYAEGVCFFLPDGTRIENFPKQHSDNCTTKHQATGGWFKPMVRVLKNMRNRMIEEGLIEEGLAPSYYLEGLLYNVPIDKFGRSYGDTFVATVKWIQDTDRSEFVCANELVYLLREGSPVTWREASCAKFLRAAVKLWNEW